MRIIKYWIPVVIWMGIIFVFSSRHSTSISDELILNFIFFKSLHIIEYAVLYVLVARAIKCGAATHLTTPALFLAFLITVVYAMTDEIHQTFVPSREGKARDVIIDAIGGMIAWVTTRYYVQKLPMKLKK